MAALPLQVNHLNSLLAEDMVTATYVLNESQTPKQGA